MKWDIVYDSPAALKDLIYYKQLAGLARGINKSQISISRCDWGRDRDHPVRFM
jgi:hypothetical protein